MTMKLVAGQSPMDCQTDLLISTKHMHDEINCVCVCVCVCDKDGESLYMLYMYMHECISLQIWHHRVDMLHWTSSVKMMQMEPW